ncbi:MAG: Ig-like domain-containing protein [Nitrospirae bacterium]|nr:Ig-like domain-containing protein [Nitrospirota bacterium]
MPDVMIARTRDFSMRLLETVFFIAVCSIIVIGCSSGVENNAFTDYGLSKGDVMRVEITGLYKRTDGLQYKTVVLEKGVTTKLSIVGYDVTNNIIANLQGTWESANKDIASVDTTGHVTAVSAGSTNVTVMMRSTVTGEVISDAVEITVLPSPVLLKPWTESPVHLTQSLWDHSSAIWNGYLYVAGGSSACTAAANDGCGFTDKVYYARTNPDGSISDFIKTTPLPRFLKGHSLVATDGYMYVIGGIVQTYYPGAPVPSPDPPYPNPDFNSDNYDTILNGRVFYTKIGADGSLGAWMETTQLPPSDKIPPEKMTSDPDIAGLFAPSVTAHSISGNGSDHGYIYVTGGWSSILKSNVNTVLVGVINQSDGSISTWLHNVKSDLPYNLSKHTSVAATVNGDNYLYVLGGNTGDAGYQLFHNDMIYAKMEYDGILSPWKYSTNVLPLRLIDHATASHGRHIFVLGGRDGDGGAYIDKNGVYHEYSTYNIFNDVFSYFIEDTGDLQLVQIVPDLPVPLFHHAAVADINKSDNSINVYVTGGAGGDTEYESNRKNSVYYISILP